MILENPPRKRSVILYSVFFYNALYTKAFKAVAQNHDKSFKIDLNYEFCIGCTVFYVQSFATVYNLIHKL